MAIAIVKLQNKIGLLGLMSFIVETVVSLLSLSDPDTCSDCGCPIDDHDGNMCRNCGEECDFDD